MTAPDQVAVYAWNIRCPEDYSIDRIHIVVWENHFLTFNTDSYATHREFATPDEALQFAARHSNDLLADPALLLITADPIQFTMARTDVYHPDGTVNEREIGMCYYEAAD